MKALRRVVAKYGPLSHRELATGFCVACKLKLPFTFFIQLGQYQKKDILWYIKIVLNLNFTVHKYGFYWNMTTPIPCLDICHGFCTK